MSGQNVTLTAHAHTYMWTHAHTWTHTRTQLSLLDTAVTSIHFVQPNPSTNASPPPLYTQRLHLHLNRARLEERFSIRPTTAGRLGCKQHLRSHSSLEGTGKLASCLLGKPCFNLSHRCSTVAPFPSCYLKLYHPAPFIAPNIAIIPVLFPETESPISKPDSLFYCKTL